MHSRSPLNRITDLCIRDYIKIIIQDDFFHHDLIHLNKTNFDFFSYYVESCNILIDHIFNHLSLFDIPLTSGVVRNSVVLEP